MGSRPQAEEWNDQSGNPAPVLVIQVADKLWDAVEAEHVAKNHMNSLETSFLDELRNKFRPKRLIQTTVRCLGEMFLGQRYSYDDTEYEKANVVWISRSLDILPIWYEFQQTVREHVAWRYWFGDLAEDDKHDEWISKQQWKVKLHNRDMGAVLLGTLEFVNAWGGWAHANEYNYLDA